MPVACPSWLLSRGFRVFVAGLLIVEVVHWSNYSSRHVPWAGICCFVAVQFGHNPHPAIPTCYVIEEDGTLRLTYIYSEDGERFQASPRPGEIDRGRMVCFPRVDSQGLFAPVLSTYEHQLHAIANAAPFTAQEWRQLRAQMVRFISDDWPSRGPDTVTFAKLLAAGDGTTMVVNWGWLAHDLMVTALAIAGGVSWYHSSLSRAARARRRRERNAAKLAAGHCPSCGYSITDLAQGEGHRCPECGRELVP